MEKDIECNDQKIKLISQIGLVNSYNKEVRQHITSTGGGGFVYNGNGYVARNTIKTTHEERIEFFLKNDKIENHYWFVNHNIKIRENSKISIISAIGENKKSEILSLINYDLNLEFPIISNDSLSNLGLIKNGIYIKPLFLILGLILFSIITNYIDHFFKIHFFNYLPTLIFLFYFIQRGYFWIKNMIIIPKIKTKLKQEVSLFCSQSYSENNNLLKEIEKKLIK